MELLNWYRLFLYHMGACIEIPHFFVPTRVWVMTVYFMFSITMQKPSYLENIIRLVAIWPRMVVNQIITRVYTYSLTLT